VTGSSRGIGKAIVLTLAEHGASVAVHYTSREDAARNTAALAVRHGGSVGVFCANLAEPGASQHLFEEVKSYFGRVDILVLNASIQIRSHLLEVSRQDFDQQLSVNLWASMELVQLALPAMIEQGWGRILTIGSVQQCHPHPEMLVYAASKAAQFNMVVNLARQVAHHGVTVNNLSPGTIETDRNTEALANPHYRAQVLSKIPSQRFGRPEDCAGAALLLCSDAGCYITGIDLTVDGGLHLE